MNTPTTPAAAAFLAKRPTLIGRVLDTDYYEHPTHGDEAPLVAVTSDGKVKRTDFYELPTIEEV